MDSQLDPLKNTDVQRVLSFARARELYPGLSRHDLRECCEAAWMAACAEPNGADLTQRFDRALVLVVWARRGSRTRMPLTDLVDQTIPRIALEPFLTRATAPSAPVEQPVTAPPKAPDRTAARVARPRRIPFASPIPVGGAVAAGAVGVAMLGATEGLPVTPLSPASSDDDGGDVADRGAEPTAPEEAAPVPAPVSEPAPLAPALGWDGLADAAAAQAGESSGSEAAAVDQVSVASGEGTGGESVSRAATREAEPVVAREVEPVAAPEPEPLPEPPDVPAPSVTATGPAAPAPIQVRRPEPPMVVQVRAPVEDAPDEDEDDGDEPRLGEEQLPELTDTDDDSDEIEGATEAAGDAIEESEEALAEQGVELPAPVDPALEVPLDATVPPVAPEELPAVDEVPPVAPEELPAVDEVPPVAPEELPAVDEVPPVAPEELPAVDEVPPVASEEVPAVEPVAPELAAPVEPEPTAEQAPG